MPALFLVVKSQKTLFFLGNHGWTGTFCVPGPDLIWILTRRNTISVGKPVVSEIKLPPCNETQTCKQLFAGKSSLKEPLSLTLTLNQASHALLTSSPNHNFQIFWSRNTSSHDTSSNLLVLSVYQSGSNGEWKVNSWPDLFPSFPLSNLAKICVNNRAVDWKNKNQKNFVNKIVSEERSQGVDKTVHSGLMAMILNLHLHEYLILPFKKHHG